MFGVAFSLRFDFNAVVVFKEIGYVQDPKTINITLLENDICIEIETSGKTNPKHGYIQKTTK